MRTGGEEPRECGQYYIIVTCGCLITSGVFPSPIEQVVATIHGDILGRIVCDDLTTETEMDVHTVMVGGDEGMGLLTHTGSSHCCN